MKGSMERSYLWLFTLLALVGFAADQTSKYGIFAWLYPEDNASETRYAVINGVFDLRTLYYFDSHSSENALRFLQTISGERVPFVNKGALFGVGNDGEGLNSWFAGISILAAIFIVYWVRRPSVACDRWLCLALGLILAGTLGNLYDRVVFAGVRDFLHWYYNEHVWPDFNIADCCLVGGAGVLLAHSFFAKDPVTEPAKTDAVPAEAAAPMQTTSPTTGV